MLARRSSDETKLATVGAADLTDLSVEERAKLESELGKLE
jgi:hypothetical protein